MKRALLAMSLVAFACRPELGPPDSQISSTRLIAVKAEPAEIAPGGAVVYRALVASPEGTIEGAPLLWSFCSAPKAITEDNIVSTACLGWLTPFGGPAPFAAGVVPADACARFGPDAPPGGYRPRDPDVTGGYFQPVRAVLGGAESFALQRVRCNLANTSADNATAFAKEYVANANPTLAPLTATIDGVSAAIDAIPSGARVVWEARWNAADAETYVRLNPATQALETHREWLRVSWYASAGAFDEDRTGRGEDDPGATTTNAWRAPSSAGIAHLWVVLRDSRGGSDFASLDVTVR